MRTSAALIKGRHTGGSLIQERPREGTALREVYDIALKGDWFRIDDFSHIKSTSRIRTQLEEYDLEIISEPDPTYKKRARKRYKCIGIWDGADLKTLEDVRVALENSVLRTDKGVNDV